MNHLGDTNKMVSDTPKTDKAQFGAGQVTVHFARKLERELNAAQKRIKRLKETGDALLELCEADESEFHLADQIDARCEQWNKAKEDKP